MAEISGGLYSRPAITTRTSPFEARVILYGTLFMVRCTSGSSNLRPMRRLIEKIVFSGLVTAWRLAIWPTSRSPLLVAAAMEGVSREPSLFSNTVGSPASITATTELVVPRSMPITFGITYCLLLQKWVGKISWRCRPNPYYPSFVLWYSAIYNKYCKIIHPILSDEL